ncbi:MBL fold metallo-hydrolase [Acidobacteria bacterium AH-259-D05]|nr:MBL fold metallo-hydrolase [Acidobacteria bacterium AH-259-D05]
MQSMRYGCMYMAVAVFFTGALYAQEATVKALTDDVYLFNFGFHSNIFVVTPEGVIATDPISPRAAKACLEEIRKITQEPVRYVIYSHDHTDHIAGGRVFKPQAQFVAHRRAQEIILERGLEDIVPPDIVVDDQYEIILGGKTIKLFHLGRIESDSNIAIFIPEDRVLMWVDAVRSYGVPYRYLEGTDLQQFRRALAKVEGLDFQHLVHGHGPATNKAQVTLFRRYFDDLERFTRAEMTLYSQKDHIKEISGENPQRFFDTYISKIASRVLEKMRASYGNMGGFDDWALKNAERMVVFLLHEMPFFH